MQKLQKVQDPFHDLESIRLVILPVLGFDRDGDIYMPCFDLGLSIRIPGSVLYIEGVPLSTCESRYEKKDLHEFYGCL